jgi:hypothetical protein
MVIARFKKQKTKSAVEWSVFLLLFLGYQLLFEFAQRFHQWKQHPCARLFPPAAITAGG